MDRKNEKSGKYKYRDCDICGRNWNVPPKVLKRKVYKCPICTSKKER